MITLSIRIGEPVSEADRRTLEWIRERIRLGLPVSDVHVLDEDGNEIAPPRGAFWPAVDTRDGDGRDHGDAQLRD